MPGILWHAPRISSVDVNGAASDARRRVGATMNKRFAYVEEVMIMMKKFLRDEQGQDLVEYTLLLAFVALASAALFIGAGTSISTIWGHASTALDNGTK